MWQAASSSDNAALDRLVDGDFDFKARSSDGRGAAWWGFEYKNAYVLANMLAADVDPLSDPEDLMGQKAKDMCDADEGCEADKLMEEAKGLVDGIKKRIEEKAKEDAADDADDPDLDDDE